MRKGRSSICKSDTRRDSNGNYWWLLGNTFFQPTPLALFFLKAPTYCQQYWVNIHLHPGRLTWNLTMMVWFRWFSFSTWVISRFQPLIFQGVVRLKMCSQGSKPALEMMPQNMPVAVTTQTACTWAWAKRGYKDALKQRMAKNWVVWVGGLGFKRVPLSNNPFHKGIPRIQTTNSNHQFTISWNNEKYEKHWRKLQLPPPGGLTAHPWKVACPIGK